MELSDLGSDFGRRSPFFGTLNLLSLYHRRKLKTEQASEKVRYEYGNVRLEW